MAYPLRRALLFGQASRCWPSVWVGSGLGFIDGLSCPASCAQVTASLLFLLRATFKPFISDYRILINLKLIEIKDR